MDYSVSVCVCGIEDGVLILQDAASDPESDPESANFLT